MDKYKETFQTWNKVAHLYQDKFMDLDLYDESYDFICDSVSKNNAKILDVGCGPGNISKYLLAKRPDFDILGIDIAPNMVELAKKNNPTAEFIVMDSRNSNEIESKFDAIVCGFCLPYLSESETEKLVQDFYNLLYENGLLYISFVEGNPEESGFISSSSGDRVFFHFHDLNELQKLLTSSGFEKQNVIKVEYPKSENEVEIHTIVISFKK